MIASQVNSLATGNGAVILANGYSGGINVAWNTSLGHITPVAVSCHAPHLIVSLYSSHNWLVSVVYNSTHLPSQISLWLELSKLSFFSFPWHIVGDFNSIAFPNEHKGGSFRYYSRKARYFLNFINENNLLDLYFTGPIFTWCNNQIGVSRS